MNKNDRVPYSSNGKAKTKAELCLRLSVRQFDWFSLVSLRFLFSSLYLRHPGSCAKRYLQRNQIKKPKGTTTINLTENQAWKINAQYTLRTTNTLHLSLFIHMSINEPTGYKYLNKKQSFPAKVAKFLYFKSTFCGDF